MRASATHCMSSRVAKILFCTPSQPLRTTALLSSRSMLVQSIQAAQSPSVSCLPRFVCTDALAARLSLVSAYVVPISTPCETLLESDAALHSTISAAMATSAHDSGLAALALAGHDVPIVWPFKDDS
ncbi:hypothetical protein BASA61_007030 [Batrachochytrium salamandrivorans]|nr:hypothetical protein BASA62_001474 [Batrachochytrium salamandrivorans]KAH6585165.1 hypothetical protein BASA61_007030 [Batrachochytrium salamandrivorans]KAH9270647.1 hypothetical protein BASA83_007255 [Batrachochytrium salamandrivorans]